MRSEEFDWMRSHSIEFLTPPSSFLIRPLTFRLPPPRLPAVLAPASRACASRLTAARACAPAGRCSSSARRPACRHIRWRPPGRCPRDLRSLAACSDPCNRGAKRCAMSLPRVTRPHRGHCVPPLTHPSDRPGTGSNRPDYETRRFVRNCSALLHRARMTCPRLGRSIPSCVLLP